MDLSPSFDLSLDYEPPFVSLEENCSSFEDDIEFNQYFITDPDPREVLESLTPPDASPSVVDQSIPIVNSSEENYEDVPINRKEWLITDQTTGRQRAPFLYEFLILLLHKSHFASYAVFKDKSRGIFEISQPNKVAHLWQHVKNRQATHDMTYDKFARAVRWYYKTDIMIKTNARYTFQFSARTLSCIIIDENNNIVINSPVTSSSKTSEHVDYLME